MVLRKTILRKILFCMILLILITIMEEDEKKILYGIYQHGVVKLKA